MRSPRHRLYALSLAAMFVFGTILGLPGTVLGQPDLVAQFGLELSGRGLLISSLFVGLLLGSLLSGALVDTLGQRAALAISSALVAVGLPLFAAAPTAPLAAAALAAIGLASASINTASNALSSQLFPTERARRMNGIAVMVGLGGLALPVATVLGSGLVSWRILVVAAGALSGVVALLAARAGRALPDGEAADPSPDPRASPASVVGAFRALAQQRHFGWFCLLILLGGGNEASMAGWTSSVLSSAGFSPAAATWGLSAHWLGLVLARLLLSSRVDAAKDATVERSAVASAVVLFGWAAATSPAALAVGPFLIGLSIALVMPTSLALAGERVPGNPGALFGSLLTLAQVGGMALPSAIGLLAEWFGVRAGIGLLVVTYAAIAWIVRRLSQADEGPTG